MLFFKGCGLVYSNNSKRKRRIMVIMIKIFIKKNIITLTLAILLLVLSVVSLFIGVIDINIKIFFGFTVNGSLCDIKTSKTSGNFVYRSRNECSRTYNAAAVHE